MANPSFTQAQNGKASTLKKTFSRETAVSIEIKADPAIVWSLLTNGSDITRWNSTITFFEGDIEEGNKIKLKSVVDEKRTFKLKVKEMIPEQKMLWSDGAAPFFKGVRKYTLSKTADGCIFEMREKIGGLMFPMAAGSIPPFDASFEQFAADLKKEAEEIERGK